MCGPEGYLSAKFILEDVKVADDYWILNDDFYEFIEYCIDNVEFVIREYEESNDHDNLPVDHDNLDEPSCFRLKVA